MESFRCGFRKIAIAHAINVAAAAANCDNRAARRRSVGVGGGPEPSLGRSSTPCA